MRWLSRATLVELWSQARRLPPILWIGIAINTILVFLPFYDPTDDTFFISIVAGFSSHAPTLAHVVWPGGFFEMALWMPAYLAYVGSGFNAYWSYTALKVTYFFLAILSAWLLYRVGNGWSQATAERLAAFALLNPVLLFVSYIWVNWDAFPIFFVLLGYLLLRYEHSSGSDGLRIFLSAFAMMVAVFFYWYPLVLFPALLLYSRTTRERLLLLGFSATIFAILMVTNVLLFSGSLSNYLAELLGSSSTFRTPPNFGLPFFTGPISAATYVPILVVIGVVLPVVLRWRNVGEAATLFSVVSLFVWTSQVQQGDDYAWIFWFTPLLLLGAPRLRLSWLAFLGLSALPITSVLIAAVVTVNGQPDGQGLLFWGYPLFHSNLIWLPTVASRARVFEIGNIALTGALAGTVAIAVWGGARRSEYPTPVVTPPSTAAKKELSNVKGPASTWARRRWRRATFALAVIALLLLAILFNALLPTLVQYHGSGQVPVSDLGPAYLQQINVPVPLKNETFTDDGSTLEIYSPSPPLVFGLPLSYQSLSLNASFHMAGQLPQSALLFNSTTFEFAPFTLDTVDNSGSTIVAPTVDTGTTTGTVGYLLMDSTFQDLQVEGASQLTYAENASTLTGTYQYLSFEFHRDGGATVPIFELHTTGGTVDFVSRPGYESLLYASSADPAVVGSVTNGFWEISGEWNYIAFREFPSEFWFDFDGVVETFSAPWVSPGNGTLTVGQSSLVSPAIAPMSGVVTQLQYTLGAPAPVTLYYLNVSGPAAPPSGEYRPVAGSNLTCDWQSTSAGTRVAADGLLFTSPEPTNGVDFGKATPGNYSVWITLHDLAVGQRLSNDYYLVPVFVATVGPFAFIAWVCRRIRVGGL